MGVPVSTIRRSLISKGLDVDSAANVTHDLRTARLEATRTRGRTLVLVGSLLLGGGLLVTAISYDVASRTPGGSYVVAWGAMAVGAIQLVRGLLKVSER